METNTLQAKDLRIGNVLHYTTAENDVLETTIDWQDLKWISEDPKGFNLAHDPIPLSEEWFLKLGFEEIYNSEYTHKFELTQDVSFEYRFEKFNNASGMTGLTYYGRLLGKIKFVHQLQNLYFALTSEELTIKE